MNIIKLYCFLPYISSIAFKKINDIDTNLIEIIYENKINSIEDDQILKQTIIDNTIIIIADNFYYINFSLHNIIYEEILPVLFEHKIADALSIAQFFYNFIRTYPCLPSKVKIYKLNEANKKKANTNLFKVYSKLKKRKKIIIDDELNFIFDLDIKLNKDYIDKRVHLLENCNNKKYLKEINEKKNFSLDYTNDELCIGSIYKNNPLDLSDGLNELIDKSIINNVYLKKYIKYKTKYIKLKKI